MIPAVHVPDSPAVPLLRLESLAVRDVRNLERIDLEPSAGVNVISGYNGQGKTSLLEAIYLVATSRSFRTSSSAELVRHGAVAASVRARFSERTASITAAEREQVIGIQNGRCSVRIDGNRPASLGAFATRSPVVAFFPDELALSSGPAARRRTLLDRLALYVDPQTADHRARYAKALRARQHLLRGVRPRSDEWDIEAFEALAAQHGSALTRARAIATELLVAELMPAFRRIAAPGLTLEASYRPGGHPDAGEARAELQRHRARDAHRPSAGFGPHRDDLLLLHDGHPARVVASQGQHRALTLALKAAETACIAAVRGLEPIQLLDDVSSELDPDRTEALFEFLDSRRGQIFLTTTRPELIVTPGFDASDRRDFTLRDGHISAASARPSGGPGDSR